MLRRTPMRRTPWTRGRSGIPAVPAARSPFPKPRKQTGPSRSTRDVVLDRAGYRCEICDLLLHNGAAWVQPYSLHHRRPRGMGGTSDPAANSPANLLLLCGSGTTGCHGYLESHRTFALYNGWLVPQAQDPAEVPVVIHGRGHTRLTTDGRYTTPEETP